MEAPATVDWTVCRSLVEQWSRTKDPLAQRCKPAAGDDDGPNRAQHATQARRERVAACTLAGMEET